MCALCAAVVTEGSDKPLKYPTILNGADVAIITSTVFRPQWTSMCLRRFVMFWQSGLACRSGVIENRPGHARIFAVSRKSSK